MEKQRKIINTLDKARLGQRVTEKEWDQKIVPKTLRAVAKEFDLLGTFDAENPINTDDELADRFFKAGWEAALRLGFYCPDTESIIKVEPEELEIAFKQNPGEFIVGHGAEASHVKARRPEDTTLPVFCAPLSIQMNEEYYIPVVEGILSSRLIDMQEGPSLDTVMGSPLLADSPYETFAGIYEYHMRKEAQWRAGRVGIGNSLVSSASTHFGLLAAFHLYDQPQLCLCLNPASLKINYTTMHKCMVAYELGGVVRSESPTMVGGYTGGPETTAIGAIATDLLQYPMCGALLPGAPSYDIRYAGNCGRAGLWAQSMATQAITRNSKILQMKTINQVSGPMTEMFFQESIVGMLGASVSGQTFTISPRSAGGSIKNGLTPLECWFNAAIFKGGAGVTRAQANEIAKDLIPKYEDQLYDPPKGMTFPELYDIPTLTPCKEYLDLYLKMRKVAEDYGIPMPGDGIYS